MHVATRLDVECARREVYGMIGSCHGLGSTSLAKGDCHGGKVCDLLGKSGCGGLDLGYIGTVGVLGCVALCHDVRVEIDRLRLLGELLRSFAPLGEPCRIWFDFGCCGVCCGFLGGVYS